MTELRLDFKSLGIGQLSKLVAKLEESNEKFAVMKDALKENKKLLSGLADNNVTRFFDTLTNKLIDVSRNAQMLKDVGGPMGLLRLKFAEFNGVLTNLGGTTVISKLRIIGGLLVSWLLPLAAIAAAIFLFSRLWKENIGGIQTKWIAFVGTLKNTWSKFEIGFRKFLHEVEPIFTAIFAKGFKVLTTVFTVLSEVIGAIFNALSPLVTAISEIFAEFDTGGNKSIGLLDIMLGAFKILGKVIVIALKPVQWLATGIGFIIKVLFKLGKVLKKIFSFSITNSPLFKGIKLIGKFIGFLKGKKDINEGGATSATQTAAEVANGTTSFNNTVQDNRQANVTIHTNNLDSRNAKDIGNQFVSPVMEAGKTI